MKDKTREKIIDKLSEISSHYYGYAYEECVQSIFDYIEQSFVEKGQELTDFLAWTKDHTTRNLRESINLAVLNYKKEQEKPEGIFEQVTKQAVSELRLPESVKEAIKKPEIEEVEQTAEGNYSAERIELSQEQRAALIQTMSKEREKPEPVVAKNATTENEGVREILERVDMAFSELDPQKQEDTDVIIQAAEKDLSALIEREKEKAYNQGFGDAINGEEAQL